MNLIPHSRHLFESAIQTRMNGIYAHREERMNGTYAHREPSTYLCGYADCAINSIDTALALYTGGIGASNWQSPLLCKTVPMFRCTKEWRIIVNKTKLQRAPKDFFFPPLTLLKYHTCNAQLMNQLCSFLAPHCYNPLYTCRPLPLSAKRKRTILKFTVWQYPVMFPLYTKTTHIEPIVH